MIQIVTASEERRNHWHALLKEGDFPVHFADQPTLNANIEVLLTDGSGPWLDDEVSVGTIVIRDSAGPVANDLPPTAIVLPPDVGPRELTLVCRLLAETVRLRRRLKHESQLRNMLSQHSLNDALTSLPNRRAWDRELKNRWCQVSGREKYLCVSILDVDDFKLINDTCGHAAGDAALTVAGQAMQASLRPGDFLARLGGDEFGLLVLDTVPETGPAVVERARAAVADFSAAHPDQIPAALREQHRAITASAGYCVSYGPELLDADHLQTAADDALRFAKRTGRNRTVSAGETQAAGGQSGLPSNSQ